MEKYALHIHEQNSDSGEIILRGIPASPGIIRGKALVIKHQNIFVQSHAISKNDIPQDIKRFKDAVNTLIKEYISVIEKLPINIQNIRALLESNLMMLQDSYMQESVINLIETGKNTENAVVTVFDSLKDDMSISPNLLNEERSHEIDQIKQRILLTLRNQKENIIANRDNIVVAAFITPDELMNLKDMGVKALITEVGGITSHTSILARNFDITHIISVKDATSLIKNNDILIIDGYSGIIIVNPTDKAIAIYNEKKRTEEKYKKELGELKNYPAETKDGKKIVLKANINLAQDIDIIQMVGAEGIGLVRTEYLVISKGKFPDCEEQAKWYAKIAEQIYPNPVTFRAFDLGSDKIAEGLPRNENNPALGLRGIRFLLARKDIFKEQICAILRASKNKNVQILLPMLTSLVELNEAKKIIEECKQMLTNYKVTFDKNIPVGVMIETPAAAILSCEFANNCDFLSIGTNDLTQYTLAADRTNEMITHQYDTFHPAVLNLIKTTIDAAKKNNTPVSVCGELAGHLSATELLIGLGVYELSIAPSILLEVKKNIREISVEEAQRFAVDLLQSKCIEEIKKKISL